MAATLNDVSDPQQQHLAEHITGFPLNVKSSQKIVTHQKGASAIIVSR